jgi:hypothetical protein
MESFLNILWLLIAVAAFGVWQLCLVRQKRQEGREPLKEWTAVACMLVFLFFAVSLTDDLHSDLIVLDECSAGRRTYAHAHACGHSVKVTHGEVTAILPPKVSMDLPLLAGPTTLAAPLEARERSLEIPTGRSPPERSL